MTPVQDAPCTAFDGFVKFAHGDRPDVAEILREASTRDPMRLFLVFDDRTGEQIELDLRPGAYPGAHHPSSVEESDAEEPSPASEPRRSAGRPKLGVVAREVTLLPRHWDWLNGQPGGASVTLRKLVDQARRSGEAADAVRVAREATYRFMSGLAGNLDGFEEASRALFGNDANRFRDELAGWPPDVLDYALRLAEGAFEQTGNAAEAPAGSS